MGRMRMHQIQRLRPLMRRMPGQIHVVGMSAVVVAGGLFLVARSWIGCFLLPACAKNLNTEEKRWCCSYSWRGKVEATSIRRLADLEKGFQFQPTLAEVTSRVFGHDTGSSALREVFT